MLIDASAAFEVWDATARWRAAARIGISHQVLCGCAGKLPADDTALQAWNERRRAAVQGHHGARSWCIALDARRGLHALEANAADVQLAGVDLFTGDAHRAAFADIVDAATARSYPLRLADAPIATELARAHPRAKIVLSRPGYVGVKALGLDALAELPNAHLDLVSCGAVRGALDAALERLGASRLLWGTGTRMEIARAQLDALDVIAPGADAITAIRWENAVRLFASAGAPR